LKFQADVEKYVASFNNTLIKIGLPGIGEYSTWSGVLGDQLNDQQVRYFATPEGFANLASGKIDVAKMIDDNVDKQGVAEVATDYSKRRRRYDDVEAGRPVKPLPKNPQTDYAKKRAKDKRDMELGETTNYWIKLQNERNTKIASLVNELKESIEKK
jgi:hypothetical protein